MKLSNIQEEYLKTIYLLEKQENRARVTDIATKMNKTKPTVNYAINTLKEEGLLDYEAYGNVTLTKMRNSTGTKNIRSIWYCLFVFKRAIDTRRTKGERRSTKNGNDFGGRNIK